MKFVRFASIFAVVICSLQVLALSRTVLVADEDSQIVQNRRADADDLSRMTDMPMLQRFVRAHYLVSVPASRNCYYLHNIPAHYRYLRPWSKLFLDRLSRQFYAKFHDRLRVTSLVRTENTQRRLARRNANAADATGHLRSSHLTGATLDISKRFMSASERQWVRRVLYSLRQQGYLYAIEEFYQPTFHIMVFRSYPQYVRQLTKRRQRIERKETRVQQASTSEDDPAITGQ